MIAIPSISDLFDNISSDFKTRFGISSGEELKEVLEIIAMVEAGSSKIYYLLLSEIQKNIYPDLAYFEQDGGSLNRIGRIRLGREPRPATQGVYTLNITGSNGGIIDAGRQFKSTENSKNPNVIFQTVSTVTLSGTAGTVNVICLIAGNGGLLNAGDELELTVTLPNIDSIAGVAAIDTLPTDAETVEEYRNEILNSFRLTPQGGAASDYIIWAGDVAGVRRIYPYRKEGLIGSVSIYVEAVVGSSTDGFGTPPNAMLLSLYDSVNKTGVFEQDPDTTKPINERGRRPLGTDIEVLPISLVDVDINIYNLDDDSINVKTSIENSIKDFLQNIRPFIDAADDINERNDVLYRSDISTILSQLLGMTNRFTDVKLDVANIEVTDYRFEKGFIPKLNSINYI